MKIGYTVLVFGVAMLVPGLALAHRSGCHTLHSCPSDTDAYVCGDLGYSCDGSRSINDVPLAKINVPVLTEKTFEQVFGRRLNEAESIFWKYRFRSDKGSLIKIKKAMRWHKANDSFGPKKQVVDTSGMVQRINAMFRKANEGRNPTILENVYWRGRIKDKTNELAMVGAMRWHRLNGIRH